MSKHPFRLAVENRASIDEFSKVFAPDAEIYAPMFSKAVRGKENVVKVIGAAAKTAHPISYCFELRDNRQTFLVWQGQVAGRKIEAVTILVDNEQGLTSQVRVLMRSWPVVTLFRNAMFELLSSQFPWDYWELGSKTESWDVSSTSLAVKPLQMAEDVVFNSPILAKSIKGRNTVEAAIKATLVVQSAPSYTSIVATRDVVVELFNCEADGYPMEGMSISKLNQHGEISELTGYLRPYPAVTLLRNQVKLLAEKTLGTSSETWELTDGQAT